VSNSQSAAGYPCRRLSSNRNWKPSFRRGPRYWLPQDGTLPDRTRPDLRDSAAGWRRRWVTPPAPPQPTIWAVDKLSGGLDMIGQSVQNRVMLSRAESWSVIDRIAASLGVRSDTRRKWRARQGARTLASADPQESQGGSLEVDACETDAPPRRQRAPPDFQPGAGRRFRPSFFSASAMASVVRSTVSGERLIESIPRRTRYSAISG